jgi:hypothetical protein
MSPQPAGTALLDRVVAVWATPRTATADRSSRRVVMSGPLQGTVAEAQDREGRTLTVARLTDGAGLAALPPESTAITIRDAHGRVLADGPIAEPPADSG